MSYTQAKVLSAKMLKLFVEYDNTVTVAEYGRMLVALYAAAASSNAKDVSQYREHFKYLTKMVNEAASFNEEDWK